MKKTTSFQIESATLDELKAIARKQERSVNFLIVKMIENYINQQS
jgi:predicted DNA-binding ribbon-helix-helix protein